MMRTRDLIISLASLGVLAASLAAQDLRSRTPLDRTVHLVGFPDAPGVEFRRRLIVKFADTALARAGTDGHVTSRAGADLAGLRAVADAHALRFAPLIALSETKLRTLEQRAALRSGVAQPDLAGMHRVEAGDGPAVSADDLLVIGRALEALDVVEFAHIQTLGVPPPGDIAPPTPDLTFDQGYLAPDPGMDVHFASSLGLSGAGLRLADCEYGWNPGHEDLMDRDLHLEPGQTIHPQILEDGWDKHGTAAVGEVSAGVNGYGVDGMAPGSEVYTYPEFTVEGGWRRVACITNAIADSSAGDVVMLEMQTVGAGFSYCPAEYDPAVWTVVRVGADAGVVVVAAAGNGNQDLDHWLYADYMAMGDSGAIIVGAASPDGNHDKLSFSTFGERVDLHGWGSFVLTLGYGNYATYGGDEDQTYSWFSGTSSATPFVAAAACLVQESWIDVHGQPLDPVSLRELLKSTGTPQGAGDPIGPLPDIRAALEAVPWADLSQALAGSVGEPRLDGRGVLFANTPIEIELTDSLASTTANLVVGLAALDAPFKGGVMVPDPFIIVTGLPTGPTGSILIPSTWPAGFPSGFTTYFQYWITDAAGPKGLAASNGLSGTTP